MEKLDCPLDDNGFPIPPEPIHEPCNNCCKPNRHHLYWPRTSYETPLEKRFRKIGQNIVRVCPNSHDTYHRTYKPPIKPSPAFMKCVLYDISR